MTDVDLELYHLQNTVETQRRDIDDLLRRVCELETTLESTLRVAAVQHDRVTDRIRELELAS